MYTVLRKDGSDSWQELGQVEASDAKAAIRRTLLNATGFSSNEGGTFVAIPTRSWHPTTIKVETRQVTLWLDPADQEDAAAREQLSAAV